MLDCLLESQELLMPIEFGSVIEILIYNIIFT